MRPMSSSKLPSGEDRARLSVTKWSHVVVPAPFQAQFQFTSEDARGLFGEALGEPNIHTLPHGIEISVGKSNYFRLANKIEMAAASREILITLCENAGKRLLQPFQKNPAQAFGINFDLELQPLEDLTSEALRAYLGEESLPEGLALQQLICRQADEAGQSTYHLSFAPAAASVRVHVNNHIPQPGQALLASQELGDRLDQLLERNQRCLQDICRCAGTTH